MWVQAAASMAPDSRPYVIQSHDIYLLYREFLLLFWLPFVVCFFCVCACVVRCVSVLLFGWGHSQVGARAKLRDADSIVIIFFLFFFDDGACVLPAALVYKHVKFYIFKLINLFVRPLVSRPAPVSISKMRKKKKNWTVVAHSRRDVRRIFLF